jgi:hypothetical protein
MKPAHGSLSEVFADMEQWAAGRKSVHIGELVSHLGEKGLGLIVIVLSLPFLQPIPLFGLSTVFGAVMMVVGVAMARNSRPWIPQSVGRREIPASTVGHLCHGGRKLAAFVERFVRPRGRWLHEGPGLKRTAGIFICLSAFLLALPLPIPGTNTPPAAALVLISLGFLERDGVAVALGYLCFWATVGYFAFLAWGAALGAEYVLPFFS